MSQETQAPRFGTDSPWYFCSLFVEFIIADDVGVSNIEGLLEQSAMEDVNSLGACLCEGPSFAVIRKDAGHVCIKGPHLDLEAKVPVFDDWFYFVHRSVG